ncbi:MAG: MiaB/RimO family radical SAM methylthiotransferase [Alphaproteobacteria bacterium]|nr:MiaB/RimO family radical SAM methylthiotransferase [Alphaproteobacteria bacterium]
MAFEIKTFGCRLNALESERIRDFLKDESWAQKTTVFHSCAITGEAERQLRQAIRKYKAENPDREIILTGCAGQLNPDRYLDMGIVTKVIGNTHKMNPDAYKSTDRRVWYSLLGTHKMPYEKEVASHFPNHTKAFVQIQQGCDHFCTYCVVPSTRGRSYNLPKNEIVKSICKYITLGYKEIVLTGADIASWRNPQNEKEVLADLIRDIFSQIKEYFWLRLSSYDPAVSATEIFKIMSEDTRLCPFLHISMQSGQDDVLEKMRRRHTQKDIENLIREGKDLVPDILFGADIITGFPTETEPQFEETYQFVKRMNALVHLHIFPYSPRSGTVAYEWKSNRTEAKERAKRLRDLKLEKQKDVFSRFLGKELKVLSEGKDGYTANYIKVHFRTVYLKGQFVDVVSNKKVISSGDVVLVES